MQLKLEVNELRQRAKDYCDLNERFLALQSKYRLLQKSRDHTYTKGVGDYRVTQFKQTRGRSELLDLEN